MPSTAAETGEGAGVTASSGAVDDVATAAAPARDGKASRVSRGPDALPSFVAFAIGRDRGNASGLEVAAGVLAHAPATPARKTIATRSRMDTVNTEYRTGRQV